MPLLKKAVSARSSRPPSSTLLTYWPLFLLLAACAGVQPGAPPLSSAPEPATPATPVYYVLHVEGRHLPADVLVNEVPIERVEPDSISTATTQVNMWIVPGRNRLRVRGRLAPGADPAEAQLVVWLRRQQASVDGLDGAENVARIEWRPSDPLAYFDQQDEFTADPAPPSELWRRARPVSLNGNTRAEVTRLALVLEQALARRDRRAIADLLDFKIADVARAVYRSPADARAAQEEALSYLLDDRDFSVQSLDPGSLQFELAAGGRLVRLSREGRPALQAQRAQGGQFLLPLYVSNVEGRWVIAR